MISPRPGWLQNSEPLLVNLVDGCAVRFNQGNRHVAMTTYNAVH
jgi:hypothetical protein